MHNKIVIRTIIITKIRDKAADMLYEIHRDNVIPPH